MSAIEIGAHIGFHSIEICSLVGNGGKVILVEPLSNNYEQLTKNLAANKMNWAKCFKVVISDSDNDVELISQRDTSIAALRKGKIYGTPVVSTVPSMTLDGLLDASGLKHVDFMKLDVEGAEALIINENQTAISEKRISTILCEFHGQVLTNYDVEPAQFISNIHALGYTLSEVSPTGIASPIDLSSFDPNKRNHLVIQSL